MKNFDYSSVNYYFITICTWDKNCIFGNPGQLNSLGEIARQGILEIESHFPGITVDKYVVMPNHVHTILVLDGSVDLSVAIGLYKSYVTRKIHEIHSNLKVWQSSFHDHVIRNQASYEKIWLYIDANPDNWSKDCFYHIS